MWCSLQSWEDATGSPGALTEHVTAHVRGSTATERAWRALTVYTHRRNVMTRASLPTLERQQSVSFCSQPGVSPKWTFSRLWHANAAQEISRANRRHDSPTFSNLRKLGELASIFLFFFFLSCLVFLTGWTSNRETKDVTWYWFQIFSTVS